MTSERIAAAEPADLTRPIRIADDVYWIGQAESAEGLRCNPFLIVDGSEAVVIDSGSRPDFGAALMKIMQAGLAPAAITTLVYQHHAPDHCASAAYFEEIIGRSDLRIVTARESQGLLRALGVRAMPTCIEDLGHRLVMTSGRTLQFIPAPFASAAGSFMTFDEKSSVLFTGDVLGARTASGDRKLFGQLSDDAVHTIAADHRDMMPANHALRHACRSILASPAQIIAPQHGWIWQQREDVNHIAERLMTMTDVGIDRNGSDT